MSDIRTKLLLGTSIGALAMIFVMAAGVDPLKANVSVVETSTPMLMGHVTAVAVHTDGSMSYVQGDNAIVNIGRDAALLQLFASDTADDRFECVRIGTGDGSGDDIETPMVVTSAKACDGDGILDNIKTAATNTNVAEGEISAEFPGLSANDLLDNSATSVTITEAVLENNAGVELSHVLLGQSITGNLGTVITITYTMTVT